MITGNEQARVIIEITYSPDDGGFYASIWNQDTGVDCDQTEVVETYQEAVRQAEAKCKAAGWIIKAYGET